MESYLNILKDSLSRKNAVLDEIAELCDEQERLLKEDRLDLEEFNDLMDKKEELIQKVNKLDDGFETLYARVGEQLKENKEQYRSQIAEMQELITQITEKSVSIQAREERDRVTLSKKVEGMRKEIRQSRRSSKGAYDYYKSMSNANVVLPQFMDQKN